MHDHGVSSLKIAFFLNLGFSLIEIYGGISTNSIAILSDALHDFGDSIALGLAWFLESYSHRKSDAQYSYGYRRFSLLSALLNIIILTIGSIWLATEGIERLQNPQAVNPLGMIGFAILGIAVNGYGAWKVSHHHSHNHKTVFWHLLEDLLGWIAVLISAIVIHFTQLSILDPILSIGINIFILYNVLKRLKDVIPIFLQRVPSSFELATLTNHVRSYPFVRDAHYVQAWSLDGEKHVINFHVVVADETIREQIIELKCTTKALLLKHNFQSSTIEIEYESENCALHTPSD